MRVLDPGHRYALENLKGDGETVIQFFKDAEIHGDGYDGPSCQEYHRALIDRVQRLDAEKPFWGNHLIIQKSREIIAIFEMRALYYKVEKGELEIEKLPIGEDGHIIIRDVA